MRPTSLGTMGPGLGNSLPVGSNISEHLKVSARRFGASPVLMVMTGGSVRLREEIIDRAACLATPQAVRVLVVEDESLVQVALKTVLDRDPTLHVVGVVEGIDAAMLVLREQAVDIVLADLFLPDGTACQLAGRMQRLDKTPPLMVTTDFVSGIAAAACLDAGAALCIDKRALHDGVTEALVMIARGQGWTGLGAIEPDHGSSLTYAEAQVLAHVASGLADAAIAKRLGYSQTYVKKMLMTVRARLGARDRAHAAAMAATIGLVKPTGPGRFSPATPRRTAHLFTSRLVIDLVDSEVEGRQEDFPLLPLGGNV